MGFARVDAYLLGESVSKPEAVGALLAERSNDPAAAPFYRALEAVGAGAADEALIALRLVLTGRTPSDASVRRLRALAGVARASARDDHASVRKILKRDATAIADLPGRDSPNLGSAARAAYFHELEVT